jgi:hypothetical protein
MMANGVRHGSARCSVLGAVAGGLTEIARLIATVSLMTVVSIALIAALHRANRRRV